MKGSVAELGHLVDVEAFVHEKGDALPEVDLDSIVEKALASLLVDVVDVGSVLEQEAEAVKIVELHAVLDDRETSLVGLIDLHNGLGSQEDRLHSLKMTRENSQVEGRFVLGVLEVGDHSLLEQCTCC